MVGDLSLWKKEMRRIVEKDPWGFCDRIYWCGWSSKMIFNLVSDFKYGEKKNKQKLVMGILQSSKKKKITTKGYPRR